VAGGREAKGRYRGHEPQCPPNAGLACLPAVGSVLMALLLRRIHPPCRPLRRWRRGTEQRRRHLGRRGSVNLNRGEPLNPVELMGIEPTASRVRF
jgi:hypothetical protein